MKVEVLARETIKPSAPTPPHLRIFKLSSLDQGVAPVYTPRVFFYANATSNSSIGSCGNGDSKEEVGVKGISQRLKESLSKVLTNFYPVAGRLKDNLSVHCNDEGVDFLEARVNCQLLDVLKQPKVDEMEHFFTTQASDMNTGGPLLLIQANFFECGGLALGVSLCHRIADAATFSIFIKGWASISIGSPDVVVPDFKIASRFPPRESASIMPIDPELMRQKKDTRRYVFNKSQIAALKAKAASTTVQQPTRVEAVTALLWKCTTALSRSKPGAGSPRRSMLFFSVNMRARLVPPLPECSLGNMVGVVPLQANDDDSELNNLPELVCRLRKGIVEYPNTFIKIHQGAETSVSKKVDDDDRSSSSAKLSELLQKPGAMDLYGHTSWCRFPFYGADFGWGKPTWVSCGYFIVPNAIVLMDTREGDGIEVWVALTEEDMVIFERNQELLEFASLNPSAF